MDDLAAFGHALGDVTRCRIVHLIEEEALCVCELADILDMPQSTVSSHLQVIRRAGLLDSERCEKWIYYRLNGASRAVFAALRKCFPRSAKSEAARARDARRAARRMAEREGSCCPGPVRLAEAAR